MKMYRSLLLLTALSGAASAATIVQVQNYSFVPTGTAALTFNQFNPSLGALASITITTNVTKSGGTLAVDNESAFGASGNISQTVTINLTSSVILIDTSFTSIGNNISATSTYFATVTADDGDGTGVQTTGTDYDSTVFGIVSNAQTKNVNTSFFSGYQGIGTYVINAGGGQGTDTSAIGGAAVAFDPARASGDVTITYTYDAIPEPTSAVIGGLGLLTLLRRRRR